MTEASMTPTEILGKLLAGDGERLLQRLLQGAMQQLIDIEAESKIGAARHERNASRVNSRNGIRERSVDTAVGPLTLGIPKLRSGSFFPSVLEPRRMVDRALCSVIQEAYISGVSTRRLDEIAKAMGLDGMDKSQVSRICEDLSKAVNEFRQRPLESRYVYVWFDATYLKVREGGRVLNRAFLLATGVNERGEREVLGFSMGASESYTGWKTFMRSLIDRGLQVIELAVSDAHEGLKRALAETFNGSSWQRCKVHFMRNVSSTVSKTHQPVVAAALKQIFMQTDSASAEKQILQFAEKFEPQFPKVSAKLLEEAQESLSYLSFPEEHWRQISSTNGLERLNRELKRRADVVGIFPNDDAVIRLLGSVLMDRQDEWTVSRRQFSLESIKKVSAGAAQPQFAAYERTAALVPS